MTSVTASTCNLLVLLSGNGSNLQAIIDRTETGQLNARVVAVISDKTDAYGIERARQHGIPGETVVSMPDESRQVYDNRLRSVIEKYKPDLIIMAGFMRILSDEFVNHYLGRLINIHPSLLPSYKGLNTHQRVLDAGDPLHGASVHFVTPALDDGPVIQQGQLTVDHNETASELRHRVHKIEHVMYPAVIQLLCDKRVIFDDGRVVLDGEIMARPLLLKNEIMED